MFGLLAAGVADEEPAPNRVELPEGGAEPAPKRGLAPGVLEVVVLEGFPKSDGVDAPDVPVVVLPPKRGCFGVLLPALPKVKPDILSVNVVNLRVVVLLLLWCCCCRRKQGRFQHKMEG
jgi:hypothetical protein